MSKNQGVHYGHLDCRKFYGGSWGITALSYDFASVAIRIRLFVGVHNGHLIRLVIIFYGENRCAGQGCGLNEGGVY